MSGKGGRGLGVKHTNRHRRRLYDDRLGYTKPALRRLGRRGGVKRFNAFVYEEMRGCTRIFLQQLLDDTISHTRHVKRDTVTAEDVVRGFNHKGCKLYGHGV